MRVGALYLAQLESAGYGFDVSTDFKSVPEVANLAGRSFQMPTFDPRRIDHTEGTAFWAFLTKDGQPVATVATLKQELGSERFDKFAMRTASAQFCQGERPAIEWIAPELTAMLQGSLAYIGELTVRKDHRGKRSVLKAFMRLVQSLILMEWPVDWTYAFIPSRHVEVGLAPLYGFVRSLPDPQHWVPSVTDLRASSEWFVGSTRGELNHLFLSDLRRNDIL